MKNATCKKLVTDRSKAVKVATLKDISLFGNFTFPNEGEFANGLQLKPLAGIGNSTCKTKAQITQLSGRQISVAGATGALILEVQPAAELLECPTPLPASRKEDYAVRFIQHAPEQSVISSLHPSVVDKYLSRRLEKRYALKRGPGKRTVFSKAQKGIMVQFYNRQVVNHITADQEMLLKQLKMQAWKSKSAGPH